MDSLSVARCWTVVPTNKGITNPLPVYRWLMYSCLRHKKKLVGVQCVEHFLSERGPEILQGGAPPSNDPPWESLTVWVSPISHCGFVELTPLQIETLCVVVNDKEAPPCVILMHYKKSSVFMFFRKTKPSGRPSSFLQTSFWFLLSTNIITIEQSRADRCFVL